MDDQNHQLQQALAQAMQICPKPGITPTTVMNSAACVVGLTAAQILSEIDAPNFNLDGTKSNDTNAQSR